MMKFIKRKRSLLLSITIAVLIIVFNFLTFAPNHIPQASPTIKGVWLTHVGNSILTYSGFLNRVFNQLSRQNFNTIYVDVYNRGTTYPSRKAPRNNLISFPFTNPLQAAINTGKRQGLKIYAWYEYGMMAMPKDKIVRQHPDWILTTPEGNQFIEKHLWLDPNNPEVRQYFLDLFTEVAEQYPDLTGIQVDDHWGIPLAFGNYRETMTNLTETVFTKVKQINPDLIISLSPNPYQFSLTKYSQDWMQWLKKDLFSELVMQIYRLDSASVRQSIITSGIKEASNYATVAVGIYAGGDKQLKTLTEIDNQIKVVKEFDYGYSIFCWEHTTHFVKKLITLSRAIR